MHTNAFMVYNVKELPIHYSMAIIELISRVGNRF